MTRKKKKQHRALVPATPCPQPRFAVGDWVRVRPGVVDADNPDIPFGGWVGTILDIEIGPRETKYLVEWSEETLAAVHPVFFRRCDRDDVEASEAWLEEAKLGPDPGTPLAIEQPTQLVPPPLDLDNPTDLARHILGVTSDDDLPPITPDRRVRFHAYLVDHVRSPIPAMVDEDGLGVVEDMRPGMVDAGHERGGPARQRASGGR